MTLFKCPIVASTRNAMKSMRFETDQPTPKFNALPNSLMDFLRNSKIPPIPF